MEHSSPCTHLTTQGGSPGMTALFRHFVAGSGILGPSLHDHRFVSSFIHSFSKASVKFALSQNKPTLLQARVSFNAIAARRRRGNSRGGQRHKPRQAGKTGAHVWVRAQQEGRGQRTCMTRFPGHIARLTTKSLAAVMMAWLNVCKPINFENSTG